MRPFLNNFAPFLLAAAGLSACGGGGNGAGLGYMPTSEGVSAGTGAGGGSSAGPDVPPAKMTCAQLTGLKIEAASIGLPTNGASVTAAQLISASGSVGEYCMVFGSIKPSDPNASDIQFQVALPTVWNSKVVMKGGGGFDGVVPSVTSNPAGTATAVTPLGRGYAVFASDGGHQASQLPDPAAFMLNQEAYRNWMGDALKKTHDAAMVVITAAYGSAPKRAYFLGGSTGGREALQIAGIWPADWDGVVALYPAQPVTPQILGFIEVSRALAAPGAYPNMAKRRVLYQAALAACDALDGVNDGIISNEKKCSATFDPSTAVLNGTPVRCAGGADTGDGCLSDSQIAALKTANNFLPYNFSLASGANSWPGMNVFTSDTNQPIGFGSTAPGFPFLPTMPALSSFAYSFVRYGVVGDPAFNYLTMDPSDPGAYTARFSSLSALDTRGNDMSGFAAKGGKLLLLHGASDMLVTPRATEAYFQQLQAKMGPSIVDSFMRFYLVPGYGHGSATTFNMDWDQLTALENWVEHGDDPKANQIIKDTVGVPGRTRPLCIYPTWPRYNGSGGVNSATSFTCVAN